MFGHHEGGPGTLVDIVVDALAVGAEDRVRMITTPGGGAPRVVEGMEDNEVILFRGAHRDTPVSLPAKAVFARAPVGYK